MEKEKSGTTLTERALQHFAEQILLLRVKFLALGRQIKNIDCLLAFCIDQCDFDVAGKPRQRGTHVVEQPRAILHHNFEKRAVSGRRIVKAEPRLNGDFWRSRSAGRVAALQQRLERRFALQDIVETLKEAFFF